MKTMKTKKLILNSVLKLSIFVGALAQFANSARATEIDATEIVSGRWSIFHTLDEHKSQSFEMMKSAIEIKIDPKKPQQMDLVKNLFRDMKEIKEGVLDDQNGKIDSESIKNVEEVARATFVVNGNNRKDSTNIGLIEFFKTKLIIKDDRGTDETRYCTTAIIHSWEPTNTDYSLTQKAYLFNSRDGNSGRLVLDNPNGGVNIHKR